MNRKAKGIYWDKSRNKWQSYITVNKKLFHLGRFINKKDAVDIRKQAEIKYFNKFRYQN